MSNEIHEPTDCTAHCTVTAPIAGSANCGDCGSRPNTVNQPAGQTLHTKHCTTQNTAQKTLYNTLYLLHSAHYKYRVLTAECTLPSRAPIKGEGEWSHYYRQHQTASTTDCQYYKLPVHQTPVHQTPDYKRQSLYTRLQVLDDAGTPAADSLCCTGQSGKAGL